VMTHERCTDQSTPTLWATNSAGPGWVGLR
jgi:hypothetical protein